MKENGHDWRKRNLVTVAGKGDKWECENCHKSFWRRSVWWNAPQTPCPKGDFVKRIVRHRGKT